MKVLIACEFSGVMRRAFQALGHSAYSCDLLPAADGETIWHFHEDVRARLTWTHWDLLIAHPPCIYMCNSGVRWLYKGGTKRNDIDPARWASLDAAVEFYKLLRHAPVLRKAIENPIMHGYALSRLGVWQHEVQFVQPWWFGEPFFKATGFELHNLPRLRPTRKLVPPKPGTEEHKRWSKVHRASPSPTRWAERSATYPGLAAACAAQWGGKEEEE
jgi:hypothetical protein